MQRVELGDAVNAKPHRGLKTASRESSACFN